MFGKLSSKPLILLAGMTFLLVALLGGCSKNDAGDLGLVDVADQSKKFSPSDNENVLVGHFPRAEMLSQPQNKKLKSIFNQAVSSDTEDQAMLLYVDLIKQFPSVIEPYLNLASIYAKNGELGKARKTLMQGFEQNPKAYLLFTSLQKLHGALASQAYSKALNKDSLSTSHVILPSTDELVTSRDQKNQIEWLNEQVVSLRSAAKKQNQTDINTEKLVRFENEILELQKKLVNAEKSHAEELADLNSQLNYSNEQLLASQNAESEILARVASAEQQAVNIVSAKDKAVAMEIARQEASKQESNKKIKLLEAQLLALQAQQSANELPTLTANVEPNADAVALNQAQENEKQAVALVQNWADSWSSQNVDEFVSHYSSDYAPSALVSRKTWLNQRQQRLTNKKFIRVKVSNFKVKDLDGQFSVVFVQNYDSNTVSGTVVKRLTFDTLGSSWDNAKIVNETIIRQ